MDYNNCVLKEATLYDFEEYLKIRSEKNNLYWTGYENPPQTDKFLDWFKSRITDPKRFLYLLSCDSIIMGSLNIDYYVGYAYIGYSVKEHYEEKGLGTLIVKRSIEIIKKKGGISEIKAWINSKNIGSRKVIEKNDFLLSGKSEKRLWFKKKEWFNEYRLIIK